MSSLLLLQEIVSMAQATIIKYGNKFFFIVFGRQLYAIVHRLYEFNKYTKIAQTPPTTTRALHCPYTRWMSLRQNAYSIVYRLLSIFSVEVQVRVVN